MTRRLSKTITPVTMIGMARLAIAGPTSLTRLRDSSCRGADGEAAGTAVSYPAAGEAPASGTAVVGPGPPAPSTLAPGSTVAAPAAGPAPAPPSGPAALSPAIRWARF